MLDMLCTRSRFESALQGLGCEVLPPTVFKEAMQERTQREIAYRTGVSQPVVTDLLPGPMRRGSIIETVGVAEPLGIDLCDLTHALNLYEDHSGSIVRRFSTNLL
jgi:hypothetical protein